METTAAATYCLQCGQRIIPGTIHACRPYTASSASITFAPTPDDTLLYKSIKDTIAACKQTISMIVDDIKDAENALDQEQHTLEVLENLLAKYDKRNSNAKL